MDPDIKTLRRVLICRAYHFAVFNRGEPCRLVIRAPRSHELSAKLN
jgi:hypothetical protein